MKSINILNEKIFETKNFIVAQDWEVPILGFFIISSIDSGRKSILDFSIEELTELVKLQKIIRKLMQEILGIENVYFF